MIQNNYPTKLFILLTFVVVLWNCKEEEGTFTEDIYQTADKSQILNVFENNLYIKKMHKMKSEEPNFIYFEPDMENIRKVKLTDTEAHITKVAVINNHKYLESEYLFLNKEGNIASSIVHRIGEKDETTNLFSGYLLVTDIEGNLMNAYTVVDGKFAKKITIDYGKKENVAMRYEAPIRGAVSYFMTEYGNVNSTTGGGGGDASSSTKLDEVVIYGVNINLKTTRYYAPTYIHQPISSSSLFGNGEPHGPNISNHTVEIDIVQPDPEPEPENPPTKIIDDELTGKEKCINDLLRENGNDFIADILNKFAGESEFDIIIQSANLGSTVNGNTQPVTINNKIVMIININTSNMSTAPVLGAVRTIMHEYIHADMHRKVYTIDNTSKDILDFKATYYSYANKFKRQHETMAKLYVDEMANTLKEFHQTVMLNDYNHLSNNGSISLDEFYEALAWEGLKGANVEAYNDLSPSKKTSLGKALQLHFYDTTRNEKLYCN
ncbi:MAG: hypothetical protein HRT66_06400 [Flavobacteriaceae bacterium]|nr:hypothetical protein [Flavobacteriaceae bacterium]